jgi:hypothetical protein
LTLQEKRCDINFLIYSFEVLRYTRSRIRGRKEREPLLLNKKKKGREKKMETTTMKKNTMGRGRPVDVDVQIKRLEAEVATVRQLETIGELRFTSQITQAIKRVRRLERHLLNALKAKLLIAENA